MGRTCSEVSPIPWFKVDDTLALHTKTVMAGNAAMGLWVRAGSWSAFHRSDGFIPAATARSLGTRRQCRLLISADLWAECDGGYQMQAGHLWEIVVGDYRPNISPALRQAVYARDGHQCLHCGAIDDLSIDHIWPYSLGGADVLANLQTLCRPCNSRKGARV